MRGEEEGAGLASAEGALACVGLVGVLVRILAAHFGFDYLGRQYNEVGRYK